MSRKEIYQNNLQIDYFSESYEQFEQDFYKHSNMDVPLTFLTDDILKEMAMSQKSYFKLNKENARDGRDHYFHFTIITEKESPRVRTYRYLKCSKSD